MEFERQSVWQDEPVGTPRLPDPVRAAAVRAVLLVSVALVGAVVSVLFAAGRSWLSAPVLLMTVLTSVVAVWAVLDVWVTRQVWIQRDGVVSSPSSAARALRQERRRARRAARSGGRERSDGRSRGRPHHLPRTHGV